MHAANLEIAMSLLVNSVAQISENVRRLDLYRRGSAIEQKSMRSLIKNGKLFVALKESNGTRFAPSRFAGYANNDLNRHNGELKKRRDGRETNQVIDVVLGRPIDVGHANYAELDAAFVEYCHDLGVSPSKHHRPRRYWAVSKSMVKSSPMKEYRYLHGIKWTEDGPHNSEDRIPANWFRGERDFVARKHLIAFSGGQSFGLCNVSVYRKHADLDYSEYEDFNEKQGNYIGVMRLKFSGVDRRTITQALWKEKGDKKFRDYNPELRSMPYAGTEDESKDNNLSEDIQNLLDDPKLDETETIREILARLGQGKFRKKLLEKWDYACAVTGCSVEAVLRASHIRPWAQCRSSAERLSENNGLLLVAQLDALFDAGLITFDKDGNMLASLSLDDETRSELGLGGALRIRPNKAMQRYLDEHRERGRWPFSAV